MTRNLTHNVMLEELDFTDSYMRDVHDGDRLFERFQAGVPADLEYDTLVGTGLSGTIAVVDLARRLGKKYLVVRKENDNTHSYQSVEGRLGKKWLFVDDFVDSGRTLGRVYDKLHMLDDEFSTEFVGVYEYKFGEFNAPTGKQADEVHSFHQLLKNHSKIYDGRYAEKLGAVSPAARFAEANPNPVKIGQTFSVPADLDLSTLRTAV